MGRIGIRKSALLGGSALMLVLSASSGAWAQCTGGDTLGGGGLPVLNFSALAGGTAASVNSLVSVLNTANTAFLTQTNAFIASPPDPAPNQQGGGVWARGIGGRVDTESVGVVSVAPNAVFGIPPGTSITCNTKTRTDYGGYQAGMDIARLNVGGANLHFGGTVGYVEANAKDISPPPPGASFTGTFQIPFVGFYAALTQGGFFIDAQVRGDFYEMNLNDPVNGIFGQNLEATGTTFSSNIGYNHSLGAWFIEPSAGIIWSRVQVDPLNVSGTLILANNPGLTPPSTIDVGRIESLLGRASIRVGTNFTAGNFALQPFATASVFHEFGANVTTFASTNFASIGLGILPDINATLNSSRVGTYGQFALGIAGQLLNTGWLGYVRGDYRIGDNIEGFSVNGGIRYQFTPEQIAALGPGLITKGPRPPAPVPVAYNWTGFYLGGYAGTTWGSVNPWRFVDDGARIEPGFAGFLGGGQVGFNYQLGGAVLGIEGDFGGSNAKGAISCPNGFFFTCQDELHWLGSVTGRLGLAVDRTLFYVKGGWAVGEVRIETAFNPSNNPLLFFGVNPTPIIGTTKTASGPTAGGGIEFGLTPNWSAKAEYMFYQLDKERFTVDNDLQVDARERGHLVRVGVNYHFNPVIAPAAVSARY
ncbi:MAG: autotransporter domain-containing protein [Xanthobacteraceae bacterium]